MALLRQLRHPGLAKIVDFGAMDGDRELFLVSERPDGVDFLAGTEGGSAREMLPLLIRILDALQYLHVRRLAAGSLRPSNVWLCGAGRASPKLLAYGMSSPGGGTCPPRDCESICHAPPEALLAGDGGAGGCGDGRAADFYSLGVLLYQALARRLPFAEGDPDFLVQKQIQGNIDFGPVRRTEGGEAFLPLLRRLLEKVPERRVDSVAEALSCLPSADGRHSPQEGGEDAAGRFSAAPLADREKEMRLLTERARRVRESGRGWTVFVAGEAGSGKSRCMEELRGWALVEGWRVVEGACTACGGSAYDPYRQVLDCASPDDAGGATGESPFSAAPGGSPEFDPCDEAPGFAAGRFKDRLTRELVRRLSSTPTILLLHDIHWADDASCVVLEYLCSDIRKHPVLLCASLRSGEAPKDILDRTVEGVRRTGCGEMLRLAPLTEGGVRRMVAGLTGGGGQQDELCDWLYRNVGGNPFFLEEMLKYLVQQRVFETRSGRWTLATHLLPGLDVPESIGAALKKRILRLSPPAREALEWLALFHRAVPVKALERLMPLDGRQADALLAELRRRQLLLAGPVAPEKTAAVNHDLVAEVAAGMIPQPRRRRMHRRIAELLERERESHGRGGDAQALVHELADHYVAGAPGARSVRYALESAARFRQEFAHENALRCFEHVFSHRRLLSCGELCQAAVAACDSMFATGAASQAMRLTRSLLRSCGDLEPESRARLYLQLALAYRHLGEWGGQERNCRAGLAALGEVAPRNRLTATMLWTELAFGAIVCSRSRSARTYLDRASASCPGQCPPAVAGRIHNLYAILHCVACEFNKAAEAGEKALKILGRAGECLQECSAASMLGTIQVRRGRLAAALRHHRHAVELSEKSRSVTPRIQASGNLAECLCRMGRIPEALAAIDRAVAAAAESGNLSIRRACDVIRAEVKLEEGDYQEARRILRGLSRDGGQGLSPFTAGHALYVSAELNFRLGDFGGALEDIRRLLAAQTEDEPLYECDLAVALRERILFERDGDVAALDRLRALERRVADKHWPYHSCLVKLHVGEILVGLGRGGEGAACARGALRLARAMNAAHLSSRAHLLSGMACSTAPGRASAGGAAPAAPVRSLEACLGGAEQPCPPECRWRALAELSFIHRGLDDDLCLRYARQAYEALGKLEEHAPSDAVGTFREAFDRSRIRLELARVLDVERGRKPRRDSPAPDGDGDANARMLLRMTEAANSVLELPSLLRKVVGLMLPAVALERGWVFLWDADAGELSLTGGVVATGAGAGDGVSPRDVSDVPKDVLEDVFREGRPLVSADARRDARVKGDLCGKVLCAPLKTPDDTIGVFYADSPKPAVSVPEAEIDLLAAFCNLVALAVANHRAHRRRTGDGGAPGMDADAGPDPFPEIVGGSPAVRAMKSRIGMVANSPLDVLITGESGGGKELVARAINGAWRRREGRFVPVDCGALSDGVAEAELFGYRKGAFTGATDDREGLLQAASGGILFLDEISNMPMRLQVKLLRALQEREVRRLGETAPVKVDIRVLAATNKDLAEEIRHGRFCGDLFYRLKAVEVHVPALRERAEDIPALVGLFLGRTAEREQGRGKCFAPDAMGLLVRYSWPGNVRELKNVVTAAYYYAASDVIDVRALPPEVRLGDAAGGSPDADADRLYGGILAGDGSFDELVKRPYLRRAHEASVVRGVVRRALADSSGVYRDAFARLGIPRDQYAATMQFLKRHRCHLEFLPFRRAGESLRRRKGEDEDEFRAGRAPATPRKKIS
jgi:DNA-binding NtrC family response regulator/tetratricopeptide (TPR) repeat protein